MFEYLFTSYTDQNIKPILQLNYSFFWNSNREKIRIDQIKDR